MHPLDNVIWEALSTRQTAFAESFGQGRRFVEEVSSLAAFREDSPEGYQSLERLVGSRGTIRVFLESPYEDRMGWTLVARAPLVQMVWENDHALNTSTVRSTPEIVQLNATHSPEMIELAALTKPGPFDKRTHELGRYIGIFREEKLVAMAGERLKVPGYTEVSAVCTHPEHTGHGYARLLMSDVMGGIRQRGETPFLHVREDNGRAIELYEKLGFHRRVLRHLAVIRKD
ncbi:MAG: GNAT family N-acetyltransferase [Candidatus Sulfotelmatobacter sp.]